VAVAEVVRLSGGGSVAAPGVVQARQRASLAARVSGPVAELPYREGERVARGAVVARLDDAALQAALGAAEAAWQAADAERARVEALLGRGAATPREAEEARARAAGAQAAREAARDAVGYAVLRAPFDGTLASRSIHVGDVVSPGTPLVEIEGEGGLEVRATVDEALARLARPGLVLTARVDGQAAPLTATLRAVSPAGDPSTHRFEVRADLPASPGLRSGLFARLEFPAPGGEARLLVPESAVFARGGLSGVFVVADGRARLRWVAVGESAGGTTEVRAGVEVGERVATDPSGLADGTRVEAP
jgi:RND family efflux transporter MFP subunit